MQGVDAGTQIETWGGSVRLLVVTPLLIERAAVRRRLPGALVLRSGMGAARAGCAARAITRIPFEALAVAGFCGATAESLLPGDVLVASEVRGPDGVQVCETARMVAALGAVGVTRIHVGPLASVDHVVRGAERGILAAAGALAADMESAWLAPAAAGRPLALVRVVLDTPARASSPGRWPRSRAASSHGGPCAGSLRRCRCGRGTP